MRNRQKLEQNSHEQVTIEQQKSILINVWLKTMAIRFTILQINAPLRTRALFCCRETVNLYVFISGVQILLTHSFIYKYKNEVKNKFCYLTMLTIFKVRLENEKKRKKKKFFFFFNFTFLKCFYLVHTRRVKSGNVN